MTSGPLLLVLLLLAILFIVFATARLKIHPFLVLIVTAYGLGLSAGLPPIETVRALTTGFGNTLAYIGIVIAAGTIIGAILERSGGALVMARTVIRLIGRARSALAMSVTGAVVSIPVFCDSGFVILSPLNRSLAATAGGSMATYAVALSMGLYATHVFVPPTPGPIAAAGELGADIGTVILLGLVVTVPVLAATLAFAYVMGRRIVLDPNALPLAEHEPPDESLLPSPLRSFAPVVVPVLLIAAKSVADLPARPLGDGAPAELIRFAGDPNTALILGVFLAFFTVRRRGPHVYGDWVGEGLKHAGTIILITGAGGALGNVLRATPIGLFLSESLAALGFGGFGLLLPFVLASALKTALGSSTVAIITTASLVGPLLASLGISGSTGLALTTLAIGAGAMTVSHANDSYFWVVSQFSGMTVGQAYRLQTLGSAVAGLTGIAAVLVMSLFLT
jgi:gluconate:H+ symporter, GntP family